MLVSGIVLVVLGLIAAVAGFFWRKSSRKSAGWWSTVAELDVAAALKAQDGTAVAVSGTTAAPTTEAGDVLKDPVHDQACCWWRETVTEHWEERVRDYSQDKNDSRPDYRWEDRSREVSKRESGLPFLLEQGATIKVALAELDLDGDLKVKDSRQARAGSNVDADDGVGEKLLKGFLDAVDDRRDQYVETTLETLPPGRAVLASGRISNGMIVADPECGLQVCQGTVAAQLGSSQKNAGRAHMAFLAGSGMLALGVVLAAAGAATA